MYVTKYIANTQYGQSSVIGFAVYLEKEGLIHEKLEGVSSRPLSVYLDKQNDVIRAEGQEYFFNGLGRTFDSEDVVRAIDANVKGLKKTEARYYTFSISPSAEEITHLRRTIADTARAVMEQGLAVPADFEDSLMRSYLKDYAVQCMDAYARNFQHPEIRDNRDLVWFGMVEKERYWKSSDAPVRTNARLDRQIATLRKSLGRGRDEDVNRKIADLETQYIRECQVRPGGSREILRPMMPKAGDNWHVHVSVSRRDNTNSFNLSPNANGRGSSRHVLNGRNVRVGFDREKYKIECERIFDRLFAHSRLQTESYEQAKALRERSAYDFEKQRLRDCEERRAEAAEFRQLQCAGYGDYYEALLRAERLDARQLMRLKGQLVQQIRSVHPEWSADMLMDYTLDDLQDALNGLEQQMSTQMPGWTSSLGAAVGDKTLQISGLEGYHPVSTSYRVLRKGLLLRQAVDRRRDTFDRWAEIYTDAWCRENYVFDSISRYGRMNAFLGQTEFLEAELAGESVVIGNAMQYKVDEECRLVDRFLNERWPDRQQEIVNRYAREFFGADGCDVRSLQEFEHMASERFLPMDARQSVVRLQDACRRPTTFEQLGGQLADLPAERCAALTADLEQFRAVEGRMLKEVSAVLEHSGLSVHAREELLLGLALDDKALDRALRDLRQGIGRVLERQHPDWTSGRLQERIKKLSARLAEVRTRHDKEYAAVVAVFVREEVPAYRLVVDTQSQLERLLREITPDPAKAAERILDAGNELMRQLSPFAEGIFEQHGQQLFGPDVCLRNEHDFCLFVDRAFPAEEATRYKDSLKGVFSRIEEKRRELIQGYVRTLPENELELLESRQGHINRYIDRHFSSTEAKRKKEALQQKIAALSRRQVIPTPQYKVYDQVVRNRIAAQAAQKARQVKMVMPVTPQQLAIKAAFKLLNVLTKGY